MNAGAILKRLLGAVLVLVLLGPAAVMAAEAPKVAVFPFDIFSREPLGRLQEDIQGILIHRLEGQGVAVLSQQDINQALAKAGKPLDLSLARSLAGQLGADYAVYGSLTKIGSRVSLDVKVLDVLGMSRPQSVFVEGVGLETISELSDQLSREVAVKVSGREKVAEVNVKGNKRIEAEAIKAVLKTKAGGPYSPILLDDDLRAVWKMGYFDDVRTEVTDSPQGKVVTFLVKEKPTVREVQIVGAEALDEKDIREQIDIKPFKVLQPGAIKESEAKIVKLYKDKGYFDATVKSEVTKLPSGDDGVKFTIDEGKKVFIDEVLFSGNKAFDDDELRDQISTQGEGWFSWITDSNLLDNTKLEQDREKLADYYFNNGYLKARVGEPQIKRGEKGLLVTFPIVEGPRFKVAAVSLSGEMIMPQAEVMAKLKTKPGEWFNRSQLREDLVLLHDMYADQGYAYVEVRPDIKDDDAASTVSIDFKVKKGNQVWFENIVITGNARTRDNVIRRELGMVEGDMFSSHAMRDSNMRLRRMNYFEDVHITTNRGSTPDRMDVKVNVKEKRTGQFAVGAGYSTVDRIMLTGSVSEANLFGRGQKLELRASFGAKNTRYDLSFTEPWLFDQPISAGVDVYDWKREYTNYDKDALGMTIRFGFPTPLRATRVYAYYRLEQAEVSEVSEYAARIIQDQKGTHVTSAVEGLIRRDTRNHPFNPSTGSDNSLSLEYAGYPIGGTNDFIKSIGDTGWYFPLFWDTVFVAHGRIGWLTGHSSGTIPIYERFFLGGINSLRGFDYYSVGPKDPATGDVIGGDRMAMANFEFRFPLLKEMGLIGLVFYDTGNSWNDSYDLGDLRKSAGCGVRWYSPVGPLRLEYGRVLDPQPGDPSDSNWEFTIGSMF